MRGRDRKGRGEETGKGGGQGTVQIVYSQEGTTPLTALSEERGCRNENIQGRDMTCLWMSLQPQGLGPWTSAAGAESPPL